MRIEAEGMVARARSTLRERCFPTPLRAALHAVTHEFRVALAERSAWPKNSREYRRVDVCSDEAGRNARVPA